VNSILLKLSPVPIAFVIGFVLQYWRFIGKERASSLLKLAVNFGLPALILISIGQMELRADLSLLILTAILILLLTWPAAVITGYLLQLDRPTLGSFVIGPMIMNLSLMYPIVIVAWGTEGFAYLALFDFGNALVALTLVYVLSCRYGAEQTRWQDIVRSIVRFPPFIALALALLINLSGYIIPSPAVTGLKWSGQAVMLLIPFALGVFLDTRRLMSKPMVVAVSLRAGLGVILALLFVEVFALQGMMRTIVIFGSLAPAGFLTLVYAARHRLDREFAAGIASLSLIIAMIYIPAVIYLLH